MSDKLTSNRLGSKTVRSAAEHISTTLISAQESALVKVRARAGAIIYNKWSKEKQQNAALGLLAKSDTDQMVANITSVRDVSNTAEAAIASITATDDADITDAEKQAVRDASDVAWPTI